MTPHNPWPTILLVGVLCLAAGYYAAGVMVDGRVCTVDELRLWGRK